MTTDIKFEDGNLIVSRVYDAPRDLVFEAWIETDKLQKWWGCAQCVGVRSEVEPKVGGKYNHHMMIEGVEQEVPGHATFVEFDPPSKLAYQTPLPNDPNTIMLVSVEFTEVANGTKVVLTHSGIPDMKVEGDFDLREIVKGGWTAAFEKLGNLFAVAH